MSEEILLKRGKDDYGIKDIPVYPGLIGQYGKDRIFKYEQFDEQGMPIVAHYGEDMAHYKLQEKNGVDVILENIAKYGKELEIVAVGPLTNVAEAIKKDPALFAQVGGLVIMGGNINPDVTEWNIRWDPEAARTVLSFPGVPKKIIGTDITKQVTFNDEDLQFFRLNLDGSRARLRRMMEIWIKNINVNPVMHDPLVVGTLVCEFCKYQKKYAYVCLDRNQNGAAGETWYFDRKVVCSEEIEVAVEVDNRAFMEFLKERICAK